MKAETHTRTELEAVEKEYATCPFCDQDYDPDEIVDWYAEPKARNEKVKTPYAAQLCPSCSKSVFGWNGRRANWREEALYIVSEYPGFGLGVGFGAVAGLLAGMLIAGGIIGIVAFFIRNPFQATLQAVEVMLYNGPFIAVGVFSVVWLLSKFVNAGDRYA